MLIITADDYGKNKQGTDSALECFSKGRITSASAMLFMEDSERAAPLALKAGVEMGLHLNFTEPFTSHDTPAKLHEHQARLVSFLTKHRSSQVIYNPFLTNSFEFVVRHQVDQFIRFYSGPPCYYNGHHHMHLCANMLFSGMIPTGAAVRNTFTFALCEKGVLNTLYRRFLRTWLSRRFVTTDSFFSIAGTGKTKLSDIIGRAAGESVEIEVHPENTEEKNFLLSDDWINTVRSIPTGGFRLLRNKGQE
jgi:predicted glycoside hydrolase/deacetylase ChbG (UPF0249 family)